MFESDADRLASIQGLGGQLVSADNGEFWAIFDALYQLALTDPGIEGTAPVLACRTSDVEALNITKNSNIVRDGKTFVVVRHEPEGTGMSVLVLRK